MRRSVSGMLEEIERRVEDTEESRGWDRDRGWNQVDGEGQETLYEFGRFAMLVDLLEEFS